MAETREESSLQELEKNAVLMIVQFPGAVVIGKCNGDMIFKPKMLGFNPKGEMVLLDMVCQPQDPMYVGTFLFSYQPGETDPVRALYFKKLTGIEIVGKGEVPKDIIIKK